MADEKKDAGAGVMGDVWWFVGFLAILIGAWLYTGGVGRADLKGIFLAPPQPLGSGNAYGPQIGNDQAQPTDASQPQTSQQQIEVHPESGGSNGYYLQQQN